MSFFSNRNIHIEYKVTASVTNTIDLDDIVNICKNNNISIRLHGNSYLIVLFNYKKCIYQITFKNHALFFTVKKYDDINILFELLNKMYNISLSISNIIYKGRTKFNNVEGNFNSDEINVIRKIHTYIYYNYDAYSKAVLFKHKTIFIQGQSYETLEKIYKHLYSRLTLPSVLKILFNTNSYFSLLPYELSDFILSYT
jgi:hypothetical protein